MSVPIVPDPVRFDELGFAYVELTVKCNLRCHFCDNEMRNLYRDMPAARFRAIVDQLRPGTRLGLHGLGEPTLHKELVDLVRHAKARGLYVYFNTNHTVTSEEQMGGLVDLGLDEMRISMSAGTGESFARYSGKELFDDLVHRTRRMVEIRGARARPLLRLVFVLTRESWREFAQVVAIADTVGVDELQVQTPLDWGKGPAGDDMTDAERAQARRAVHAAAAAAQRVRVVLPFAADPEAAPPAVGGQCHWPFNAMWITADGAVTPCCNLHDPRQINLGDAFSEPLDAIWLGERYRAFRARYRANAVPECRTCPVHYGQFKSYTYHRSKG
jgi:radical SAM protein with 4Fe4S-binding SPASM domain